MTDRERFRVGEAKERIFARDNYTCVCGCSIYQYGTPQLAHRLPQTKSNIKKYGKEVIHSDYNLVAVCSLACNKDVDVGRSPGIEESVVQEILLKEGRSIDAL